MKWVEEKVAVAPQIVAADLPALAAAGVRVIVNNRPDGEEPGQPSNDELASAAAELGLAWHHVPMGGQLTSGAIADMTAALDAATGPVLAFCRSGTRSTYLWACARAGQGATVAQLAADARAAGYDLTPLRPALDALAARR